jgi:hypothetical protein
MGCCPDFDDDGHQMNMKCVCGATVPLSSRSSLCRSCLADPDDPSDRFDDEDDYEDDDWDTEDSWLDGSYED